MAPTPEGSGLQLSGSSSIQLCYVHKPQITYITDNMYVDRLAAMTALGVEDLDTINGIRVTVELL